MPEIFHRNRSSTLISEKTSDIGTAVPSVPPYLWHVDILDEMRVLRCYPFQGWIYIFLTLTGTNSKSKYSTTLQLIHRFTFDLYILWYVAFVLVCFYLFYLSREVIFLLLVVDKCYSYARELFTGMERTRGGVCSASGMSFFWGFRVTKHHTTVYNTRL